MLKVVGCFTEEHNYWLVGVALIVCLGGSALTLRLFRRLLEAPSDQYALHTILAGVMGGATIWTTHFVAMVAYDPAVEHAYEPVLTAFSLFVAIAGCIAAMLVASIRRSRLPPEVGGAVLGATVAAMHYLGMAAFELPGRIVWDWDLVAASVVFGMLLGALAFNRVACGAARFRCLSSIGAMTSAICLTHFTGMGAVAFDLDPTVAAPERMLSDATLTGLVVAIMSLLLIVGLATLLIEAKIEERAGADYQRATSTDALTGLPNRQQLNVMLDQLANRIVAGEDLRFAVLTLDLDGFKEINDRHGHATGDAFLKAIGGRLSAALDPGEFAARSGGDEFIAVKYGYERQGEVRAFAERLAAQMLEPVAVGEGELSACVSVGIAAHPEHGSNAEALINNSALALTRAKRDSLEKIYFFDEKSDHQSRERIELTHDLRQALANNAFELHYQLQNDVRTRAPVGFEALLRWRHPARGIVSPGIFIPIAESTGLIRPIGLWVLQTACKEAASWTTPFRIAVNVAPQQLAQPAFVEHVADALRTSGLASERLELEITEASIIDDQHNTLDVIHRLQSMGVRIVMDDFGTGYSSLASLRAFPFDKIKIDRSFIRDVHKNAQSAAIVRATLLLGAALKIPVLAEGVEAEEELAFLSAEECREVQGFMFGKPMTVEKAREIACGLSAPARLAAGSKAR